MTASGEQNPTSYFSAPSATLDPELFDGKRLKPWVRNDLNRLLYDFLGQSYQNAETWAHPWLAGSGVSYQWSAARNPGDLDCLVGVDYVQFRKANPRFVGLSDKEISDQLNEDFRAGLQPQTANWHGYEVTFFVNNHATDIRAIKPYAAYSLKYDEWTVPADPAAHAPQNADWDAAASRDAAAARQTYARFEAAHMDLDSSRGEAQRRNAESRLSAAVSQGMALFDDIHLGRREAFNAGGEGYADFHNYRWQAAKRNGTIDALRAVRDYAATLPTMPDADTLIRRAALYRA
jgi:hypothetical protein